MITSVTPDIQKAGALIRMADITLERLEHTDIFRYPSNTLVDYYDIIHKLLEALALRKGAKIKGEGAHQELVEYVAKLRVFDEQTRQFLQQLRDYRNRISYEGFMVQQEFIVAHHPKIKAIVNHLKSMNQ